MSTPDVTQATIAVIVGQVIAVAVAFGVNLTGDQQKALLALAVTIGSVILWADQQIRKHRAENAAAIAATKKPSVQAAPFVSTGTTAASTGTYVVTTTPAPPAPPKPATPTRLEQAGNRRQAKKPKAKATGTPAKLRKEKT